MSKKSTRIDMSDLAPDHLDELTEDDVRKVVGGASGTLTSPSREDESAVTVRGWDPQSAKSITGRA